MQFIIFIILLISFLVILIMNDKKNNKIIKYLFTGYGIIYFLLIILFDNNYIYEFLKAIITYIWYPTYLLFVVTIIISIILFIYSLLSKKINFLNKIANYVFFLIAFVCYNTFLSLKIDPSIYSELYTSNSLLLMRITTILCIATILFNIILRMRGKYDN
ncbi:MAG: hypothetical protein IJ068_05790 [Bacilli bacterium]|nr:hypothetical protein [Bacilli bacterium]